MLNHLKLSRPIACVLFGAMIALVGTTGAAIARVVPPGPGSQPPMPRPVPYLVPLTVTGPDEVVVDANWDPEAVVSGDWGRYFSVRKGLADYRNNLSGGYRWSADRAVIALETCDSARFDYPRAIGLESAATKLNNMPNMLCLSSPVALTLTVFTATETASKTIVFTPIHVGNATAPFFGNG